MAEAFLYAGWALGMLVDEMMLLMHCPIEWSDPVHAGINDDGKFTGSAPSQEYLGFFCSPQPWSRGGAGAETRTART